MSFRRATRAEEPDSAARQPRTRSQDVADSPSLMTLVLVAAIGVLLYTVFLFDFSHRGDLPAYLLVLLAESFIIVQSLISLWTILSSGYDPRDFTFNQAQTRLYGDRVEETQAIGIGRRHAPLHLDGFPVTVDVFITTYGEALSDIRKTVTAAMALDGRHTTYVLDDGKSVAVRDLARELGAEYIAREGNAHAKAGNVNHALSITTGDFFVILDADFVARGDFLHETVPFFADPTVAFVQSPQTYGNLKGLISRGAGYMQTVFYRFTQPGKNRFNAAFCVGTNVIFRRTAVMEIGGIWQESKSEDVWTSMKLHERGWRSIFIGTELAVGHTPETIETYTKQQLRWATGGFEILFRANPMGRGRNLTLDQRLQYFGTATFYLVGVAPGLLVLVPPLQIYFGITPISPDVPALTWFLYYAGFYFMQIVVALFTIGSFRWETLLLATASFPIYVKAFFNALLRRDQAWSVTGQKGVRNSPFAFIVPQVLFFVFLLFTSVVGLWQAQLNRTFDLAVFWNLLNTLVLGAFVVTAFRESREIAAETRELRRLRRAGQEPVGEHDEKVVTPVLPDAEKKPVPVSAVGSPKSAGAGRAPLSTAERIRAATGSAPRPRTAQQPAARSRTASREGGAPRPTPRPRRAAAEIPAVAMPAGVAAPVAAPRSAGQPRSGEPAPLVRAQETQVVRPGRTRPAAARFAAVEQAGLWQPGRASTGDGPADGPVNGHRNGQAARHEFQDRQPSAHAVERRGGRADGYAAEHGNGRADGHAIERRNGHRDGHAAERRGGGADGHAAEGRAERPGGSANGHSHNPAHGSANSRVNGSANGHAHDRANGRANGHARDHANGRANGHARDHANGHANGSASRRVNGSAIAQGAGWADDHAAPSPASQRSPRPRPEEGPVTAPVAVVPPPGPPVRIPPPRTPDRPETTPRLTRRSAR